MSRTSTPARCAAGLAGLLLLASACAIAQTQGATVIEKPVTGCEARIMGYGEKAIIVVNSESIPPRPASHPRPPSAAGS